MRKIFVLVHRYVGLALTIFLIVIGLTGSIIAFFPELDTWLNPELTTVTPQGQPLDALTLRDKLEAQDPKAHVHYLIFPDAPDKSADFYVRGAIDPASGEPFALDYDQVFANPYIGERLGQRLWGDFSLHRKDIITFLYYLHYSLVLPEMLGETFMGIVALVWAFDCFVGFYLTLPNRIPKGQSQDPATPLPTNPRSYWQRWLPSWKIKIRAGATRIIYDSHRAFGLWTWLLLLMFAWSGFAFNLPKVYSQVMQSISHYQDIEHAAPELEKPLATPAVDWRQALRLGEKAMAAQSAQYGFTINRPQALVYRRETGLYFYKVHSSVDVGSYGSTTVVINASTGDHIGTELPTTETAANTFTTWITVLHTAGVFGWPWKIVVSIIGLVVVGLSVTGVLIWQRKRRFGN